MSDQIEVEHDYIRSTQTKVICAGINVLMRELIECWQNECGNLNEALLSGKEIDLIDPFIDSMRLMYLVATTKNTLDQLYDLNTEAATDSF